MMMLSHHSIPKLHSTIYKSAEKTVSSNQYSTLQTFHFQTGLHAFCLQKNVFTHPDYFMQAGSIKLTSFERRVASKVPTWRELFV